MRQPDQDLIGAREVAELLNLSYATVKRHTKAGRIPYVAKAPGDTGAYLYDRSDVEALRESA